MHGYITEESCKPRDPLYSWSRCLCLLLVQNVSPENTGSGYCTWLLCCASNMVQVWGGVCESDGQLGEPTEAWICWGLRLKSDVVNRDFSLSSLGFKVNSKLLRWEFLGLISPSTKHLKIWSKFKLNHASSLYYQWKDPDSSVWRVTPAPDVEV